MKKTYDVSFEKWVAVLPRYKIEKNGLKHDGEFKIPFCKGNSKNEDDFKQSGVVSQSLIFAQIKYLEEVNIGSMKTESTTKAITHLYAAMELLNQRTKDRVDRGVSGSYDK